MPKSKRFTMTSMISEAIKIGIVARSKNLYYKVNSYRKLIKFQLSKDNKSETKENIRNKNNCPTIRLLVTIRLTINENKTNTFYQRSP